MDKFDIVVIGGGAAGICAAISAARAGKTLLFVKRCLNSGRKFWLRQRPLQPAQR